jgi:cell division protein FtsQ
MAQFGQRQQPLLVARDGVVFAGDGYESSFLESLPWLDGVVLKRTEAGFEPIQCVEAAADLLAKARLETERLYRRWKVVSLARLTSDREIEVRTTDNVTVTFDANGEFLRQLARLDFMWDQITSTPVARATVNLALGRDVPVMLERAPAGTVASSPGKSGATPALIQLPRVTPPADAPASKPTPAAPASNPAFIIRLP